MSSRLLLSSAGTLVLGVAFPAGAAARALQAPPSREVTIRGTVIDVSCKFGQGLSGANHKMSPEVCANKGIPLAIPGSDGKLYIPTSAAIARELRAVREDLHAGH